MPKKIKNKVEKGEKLVCEICGFSVIVDRICKCGNDCEIVCCKKPMKLKV